MKTKLTFFEILSVASMLFGLFFGAGNLIFPVLMGQMAGHQVIAATAGFLVTGVGLPLLGVAALGIGKAEGLQDLSSRVSQRFGLFFTCLLYLTIGPFFAIPRCASVSFTVGIEALVPQWDPRLSLAIFSILFFAIVLFFSLRPGKILVWVGKLLNPLFLMVLFIFIVSALLFPLGDIQSVQPEGSYVNAAVTTGLLEGYNTMDALAGLAFGIIVVQAIRSLGITEPVKIAQNTILSGSLSALSMGLIYTLLALIGTLSRGAFPIANNGGETLSWLAAYYFGPLGAILLALMVTLACLKTAVGLITSCSETFRGMFSHGPSYKQYAIGFCLISLLIANLGLDVILSWTTPVLMFLYPLAIVLIVLTLVERWLPSFRIVSRWTLGFAGVSAALDFLVAMPAIGSFQFSDLLTWHSGFAWIIFALIGFVIGYLQSVRSLKKE
ncbi:Branched-chain amino acid transport system 2 carrier protein [Clostridiales bacterium CHKCI006]|nr:Branched-chain amino acid transport system 2 carrier protein [Clostridiales bacterium CHKCI006]